jgi:hypothetical protein
VELFQRLNQVILDSEKIHDFEYDPEMTADLYYQVSTRYNDSPDLRVAWLQNLGLFHVNRNNLEEAAMVNVHIAALVCEYLVMSNGGKALEGLPESMAEFAVISPNVAKEAKLPTDLVAAVAEGMYNPKIFSEAGLLRTLTEAISLARRAQLYELVIDIYRFVIDIHQRHRDYKQLALCFADLEAVCSSLTAANMQGSRLFSNFYRVGFYGAAWPADLRDAKFIYKEHANVLLPDFTSRLTKQLSRKYGEGKVELVSNLKQVETMKLEPDIYYFQIASVSEFFTPEDRANRKLLWDRKFNINEFEYTTPFTKSGKAHGDLHEQYLRQNFVKIGENFPHVRTRSRIVEHRKVELSPLQNSTEMLRQRVIVLNEQLDAPNLKTLQGVLQGTVMAAVNAGPMAVADAFLKDPKQFDPKHIAELKDVVKQFIGKLKIAVHLERTLIADTDKTMLEFQDELEKAFGALRSRLQDMIPDTKL